MTALVLVPAVVQAAPAGAEEIGGDAVAQAEAADSVMHQLEDSEGGAGLALADIEGLAELGPMPWLSMASGRGPEVVEAWTAVAAQVPDGDLVPRGKKRLTGRPLTFEESEAPDRAGANDTPEAGELIRRFGTGRSHQPEVTITGVLSGAAVRSPIGTDCESTEPDGSIDLANPTPVSEIDVALCIGEIGDGAYGETSGDVDFFGYGVVEKGSILILDTYHLAGSLDPVGSIIGIYDADGNLLGAVDDAGASGDDSFLQVIAPTTGEYYGAIAGCCELSADPYDPASGPGARDGGAYELFLVTLTPPCASIEDDGSIALANTTSVSRQGFDFCSGIIGDGPHGSADADFYAIGLLEAGSTIVADVFAFDGTVRTVAGLYDGDGNLLASAQDSGDPAAGELLRYTVETTGEYYLALAGCCELPADADDPFSGSGSDDAGLYELAIEIETPPCESREDDGAIPLANDAAGVAGGSELHQVVCFGTVGDGPQAELDGDVDFFRTRPLPAGRLLIVDFLDIGGSAGAGDLTIGVYDEAGNLLATGADDPAEAGPGSDFFSMTVPADGVHYVAVGGAMPTDPFDPTTGTDRSTVGGYSMMFIVDTTEGFLAGPGSAWGWGRLASGENRGLPGPLSRLAHELEGTKARAGGGVSAPGPVVDTDVYLVDLHKGDAISGGFDNARVTGILDPAGVTRSESGFNPSFVYPVDSPLRHDRRVGFDHVATVDGIHAVYVTEGSGSYEGELRVVRSGLAPERTGAHQRIFLDFDGGRVGGDVFRTGIEADLSPLSAFLERWGLDPGDEDALIDAVIDVVVETIDHELGVRDGRHGGRGASGRPRRFDVEILNSRDHGDRWGDPDVSRVIIGGTIDELRMPTIGMAEAVDPGNTETEETAVVLLDQLSGPAGSETSLNTYDTAPGVARTEFIGFAVGHLVSHEIGHLIGNWHQEAFNGIDALMDVGGDFPAVSGVGDDGIFGTGDDIDLHFIEDVFNVFEGFRGVEDTAGRSVFALSTGSRRAPRSPRPA